MTPGLSRRSALGALLGAAAGRALASPPVLLPDALQAVADGVHVLVGSRDAAHPRNGGVVGNLGIVATPAGAVVVNTGSSVRIGEALIARAQQAAGGRIAAAIVTQARPEYVMGMAAFVDRGIEVIAHEATARLIARRCPECLRRLQQELGEDAMRGTRLVDPTRLVAGSTRIAPGGRALELRHLGPAQTAGDLVVADVATGVAFAGAMVPEGRVPELEDPGGARPWRAALAALAALPVKRLVPGYGEPGAAAALIAAVDAYLARLEADVQAHWDRGADLLGAQREIAGAAWRHWAQHDPLHARNVQREYLAAEARWLSGR
ncbi:MAG TPA: MBL fold metallo-hydrolase [Albitalea sp.]